MTSVVSTAPTSAKNGSSAGVEEDEEVYLFPASATHLRVHLTGEQKGVFRAWGSTGVLLALVALVAFGRKEGLKGKTKTE